MMRSTFTALPTQPSQRDIYQTFAGNSGFDSARSNQALSAQSSQALGEDAERERLRRICSAVIAGNFDVLVDRLKQHGKSMKMKDALDQLFGHINIDPDGGIGNLRHGSTSQLSKMERFNFSLARHVVFFLVPFRLFLNVPQITYQALMIIYCHYSPSCPKFMDQEEDKIGAHINLPLSRIALVVAVFELARGTFIMLRMLYHMVRFLTLPDPSPLSSDVAQLDDQSVVENTAMGFKKYRYLAYVAWEDLYELQNFSAMSVLSRVHPGLISHHARSLKIARNTSLKVLKRYLGFSHMHMTEEEILDFAVIRLLQLRVELGEVDSVHQQDLQKLAQRSILQSPYVILCDLKDAEDQFEDMVTEDGQDDNVHCNTKELKFVRRVQCVKFCEFGMFWTFSLFLFAFGSAAFLVKLASVSATLFNPTITPIQDVASVLSFMNQVMGIVAVNPLMRMGLYRFIFGGHDAQISAEEDMMKRLYEARLAQAIWTTDDLDSQYKRIVLLATFESDDLQRLILEENDMLKSEKTLQLWYAEPKPVICGRQLRRGRGSILETLAVMWTQADE